MTIRVVLVDDHAIVRTGLKAVLAEAPEIDVVGEASGGYEAVDLLTRIAGSRAAVVLRHEGSPQFLDDRTGERSNGCLATGRHIIPFPIKGGALHDERQGRGDICCMDEIAAFLAGAVQAQAIID